MTAPPQRASHEAYTKKAVPKPPFPVLDRER